MKKHFYKEINTIFGNIYSACGIHVNNISDQHRNWSMIRKKITCENCKRTKIFKKGRC